MQSPLRVSSCKTWIQYGLILMMIWMLAACGRGSEYAEPPPPKVTIAEPLEQEVID